MTNAPYDRPAREELVGATRFGSFESWYRTEHPRLVAVLRHLGADPDAASEVAADAFSRALEHWAQVETMASPSGWTFQVAFNGLRRRSRRAAVEGQILRRQRAVEVPPPGGETWSAVRALPLRQRTAVTLHYLLDLPYTEVAQLMKITEGTVAATLAAARRELAKTLAEPGDGGSSNG